MKPVATSLVSCSNAGVGSGEGVVAVSAYMGRTRGSRVLASAGDVLEMSVVRGVGGMCDICMCLARGWVEGVGEERIGFGVYQFWRNMGKVGYVSVFGCGGVGGEWVVGLGQRGWGGVMSVCVVSLDYLCCGRSMYLYIVLGGFLHILGAPSVQSCCTLSISVS